MTCPRPENVPPADFGMRCIILGSPDLSLTALPLFGSRDTGVAVKSKRNELERVLQLYYFYSPIVCDICPL